MGNPFEKIVNVYDNQVKEADEKGWAEKYAQTTAVFCERMKKEGFTITDIENRDGYCIFGFGTNSVVHFHIKECPHWKFGIWYNNLEDTVVVTTEKNTTTIIGELFAQHEDYIDKFKPSNSSLLTKFEVRFDEEHPLGNFLEYGGNSIDMVNYIKKYSYLAFYRHMHYVNEYEYISRFKAWKFRISYIMNEKNKKFQGIIYAYRVRRWFNKHAKKFTKQYPDCWFGIKKTDSKYIIYPSYEPYMVFPYNFDFNSENKCYNDFQVLEENYRIFERKMNEKYKKHELLKSFARQIEENIEERKENNENN